ncbi:hypothetical protein SCHPADRAFT_659731 [Schizopora paradoxa]|uniref:Uncharacterized protein n=1 Tax=Schizopora paradoxa TaxID=27342 RepID=A0A0H2RQU5_9AGAM|nr:hypothetical protein SCHPADRAFT_659731 [Schizopora paradoxa]
MSDLEEELATVFSSMQPILENMVYEITRSIKIQSVENQRYVNHTVIATFLSGVTASVLQIVGAPSSDTNDSNLSVAVLTSLFSSLIISSASAALSLLSISWIQTIV